MHFLVALSRASSTVTNHCLRHLRSTCNVAAEKVTLTRLKQKHRKQEPITVVSTHDYPSAVHVDVAGIDVCHVGDSVSMVIHGHDTTIPITLEQMLAHCRAVARGAKRPLLVGDLPFGTYESSSNQVYRDFNLVIWFHCNSENSFNILRLRTNLLKNLDENMNNFTSMRCMIRYVQTLSCIWLALSTSYLWVPKN